MNLAVLSLLDDAAASAPLLVVVDDAQWLDRESLETVAFVARRLCADHVGMLFAIDDQPNASMTLDELPSLALAGLSELATADLLGATSGQQVDGAVAHLVRAETGGNPLAVVELASELSTQQLLGTRCLPEPLPLRGRLEERFLRRVRDLGDEARALLVLAAAAGRWTWGLSQGWPNSPESTPRRRSRASPGGSWHSTGRSASAIP